MDYHGLSFGAGHCDSGFGLSEAALHEPPPVFVCQSCLSTGHGHGVFFPDFFRASPWPPAAGAGYGGGASTDVQHRHGAGTQRQNRHDDGCCHLGGGHGSCGGTFGGGHDCQRLRLAHDFSFPVAGDCLFPCCAGWHPFANLPSWGNRLSRFSPISCWRRAFPAS